LFSVKKFPASSRLMSSFSDFSGSESESASEIVANAIQVRSIIASTCESLDISSSSVELVAVSKTKPKEMIMELYNAGHRHFGENYFQELVEKSVALPKDIIWHFIGHLQSNKANQLVSKVSNLAVVETVDTLKLALKLQNACINAGRDTPLDIYVQVDTSGEDSKSGVLPADVIGFVDNVVKDCSALRVRGLMTIGAPGDLTCFDRLVSCREELSSHLGEDPSTLTLSMGMSGDYVQAIERGSTSVRIGSTIFGARQYATQDKTEASLAAKAAVAAGVSTTESDTDKESH
jgi:PLP dependent protein